MHPVHPVHRPLWAVATGVGLVVLPLLCLASVVAPASTAAAGPAILAVGLLVGVPHGALDHRIAGGDRRRVPFVARYVLTAGAVLIAFAADPPLAFAVLLVLSMAHFAEGEVYFARLRDQRQGDRSDLLAGAVCGTAMVVLPLLTHVAEAQRLISMVIGQSLPLPSVGTRNALVALLLVSAVAAMVTLLARGRRVQAAELAVVVAVGLLAPAGAAFGVTFAAVHSAHHLARLRDALRDQRPVTSYEARRAEWVSAVGPLLAVAVAGGLLFEFSALPWLRLVLGGMLALTVPHAFVVRGMAAAGVSTPSSVTGPDRPSTVAPAGRQASTTG
jgi:Brp/Blh family beta-carotene 15,15'-monooxygenase